MISGLILSACSSKKANDAATAAAGAAGTEKAAVPVKVVTLEKTRIARTIDYTATVLPFEEVNMAPSTPGRIERIYVETGDRVTKGQELFLMDRTQLYQQKVQLASVSKDLSRLDTLLRMGSVTQQQYDQMKTQYDVSKQMWISWNRIPFSGRHSQGLSRENTLRMVRCIQDTPQHSREDLQLSQLCRLIRLK